VYLYSLFNQKNL